MVKCVDKAPVSRDPCWTPWGNRAPGEEGEGTTPALFADKPCRSKSCIRRESKKENS